MISFQTVCLIVFEEPAGCVLPFTSLERGLQGRQRKHVFHSERGVVGGFSPLLLDSEIGDYSCSVAALNLTIAALSGSNEHLHSGVVTGV